MNQKQSKNFYQILASSFGVGFFPYFPGTLASLIVLVPFWFFKTIFSTYSFIFLLVILTIIFLFIVYQAIKNVENKDPKFIIIDEYLGQGYALVFCDENIFQYFLAFLFFRIFDILKPFPINLIDLQKNSFGVIFDDIVAGIFSGIIIYILYEFRISSLFIT